jgi:eukaryotic-like serine/threonine-protein kinase
VGPYRVQARLGSGGMGVVFFAFDLQGTPVAIKMLPPVPSADARARMRREADLLASVQHPRIGALVDADLESQEPYLVLAYVAGPALPEADLPLGDTGLHQLAGGLAEAVAALHTVGIVHRDVKPANVILTYDGPVLVDLGIARTAEMTAMTQAGSVIGSPGWMAPEQFRGDPVGPATDVWGWAVVLAYAATGRNPFGDQALEALGWRIQHGGPDLQGLPDWLRPAVSAGLSKTPEARPPAAQLMAAPSTKYLAVRTAAQMQEDATVVVARPAEATPGPRLGWRVTAALLTCAVLAGSAAAYLLAHRGPSVHLSTAGLTGSPSTTVTPTPTPTASTSPTAVTKPAPPRASWPPLADVLRAVPVGQGVPAFPTKVTGYAVQRQWTETVRAFTGSTWSTMTNFPATMNGCVQQRFYVRWRSLNPNAVVEASFGSVPEGFVLDRPVSGVAGWQSGYGCGQPMFLLKSSRDGSTLTDIIVEVQRFVPTV